MTASFRDIADGILDVLVPARCPECGEPVKTGREVFCRRCSEFIERAPDPIGASVKDAWEVSASAFAYGGPLAAAVIRFKHGEVPALGSRLARLAMGTVTPPAADLVVPVPLHPARQRARGFNQSAVVARALARGLGVPLVADALVRTRDTPTQGGLSASGRRVNVRGAFSPGKGAIRLPGRSILLVDDVWTTGATCGACARALRRAGADHVRVYTLARVV